MLNNMSHDNYSQLLPKVGLSYTIDSDGSNVYATVCKGYRAGGYNIQMFSDILQHELNENSNKAMTGSYDIPHTQADYDEINNTISTSRRKAGTMKSVPILTCLTIRFMPI